VHFSVHFRTFPGQPATAVHNDGPLYRRPGHDGGMHIGHVLPVANHIRYHVGGHRSQFPNTIHGSGTTDLAQGQGPGC